MILKILWIWCRELKVTHKKRDIAAIRPTTEMKGGSQNLAAYNISPLAAGGPRGLTKSKSDGLESVAATATV